MNAFSFRHPPSFWYPDKDGGGGLTSRLLAPLSWLLTGAGRWRRQLNQPQEVDIPVICIGNVTLGGAGKTPLALALGEHLRGLGWEVQFLSRGYGGSTRGPLRIDRRQHDAALVGDEALELADFAPCWVARDRLAGARAAASAGAELLILDDGMQNTSLNYDLVVQVVDGKRGLGNGRVVPAGPLREPWQDALARSDAIIIMGKTDQPLLREMVGNIAPAKLFHAQLFPRPMALADRLLAFSGIGYGEKLLASLSELGGNVVANMVFPDHHRFTQSDAASILTQARRLNAKPVTTRKDSLRLACSRGTRSVCERLYEAISVVRVDARLVDAERFDTCLKKFLPARQGGKAR